MSDLLELAVTAHGGWDRWQKVKKLTAQVAIGGGLWHLKGWPGALADTSVSIDPHRQHAEYFPFTEVGRRSIFETERVAVVDVNGATVEERTSPRESFNGHTLATPWDMHHLNYFSGYAMWTYLTTPFLFQFPGFQSEEIAPWNEDGDTWRRLKVIFPQDVHSHSTEQTFYFDATGILRRHDYSVDILGGSSSANYATEPKEFGGIIFPTKRRVYAIGQDNKPLLDRVAVSIDFLNIDVV